MEYQKKAEENFLRGMNCAQAVFLAFQDRIGLDENTMLRLSCDLGGGMGGMRETCGAVNAMFLVMGVLYGTEDYEDKMRKTQNYQQVRALADAFKARYGTIQCRELLKSAAIEAKAEPSERTSAYYAARPCTRYVGAVARMLQEQIDACDQEQAAQEE